METSIYYFGYKYAYIMHIITQRKDVKTKKFAGVLRFYILNEILF